MILFISNEVTPHLLIRNLLRYHAHFHWFASVIYAATTWPVAHFCNWLRNNNKTFLKICNWSISQLVN